MSRCLLRCRSLLFAWRLDERLVNVRQDTTSGNRGAHQRVELLVSSNRQLQVSRRDALHAQVLRCIACKFEHLGGEVLQDRRGVDGGLGTDADVVLRAVLEVTVDTTDRELRSIKTESAETCRNDGKVDKVSIAQSLQDAKHNCGQSDPSESSSRLELCVVWTSAWPHRHQRHDSALPLASCHGCHLQSINLRRSEPRGDNNRAWRLSR